MAPHNVYGLKNISVLGGGKVTYTALRLRTIYGPLRTYLDYTGEGVLGNKEVKHESAEDQFNKLLDEQTKADPSLEFPGVGDVWDSVIMDSIKVQVVDGPDYNRVMCLITFMMEVECTMTTPSPIKEGEKNGVSETD